MAAKRQARRGQVTAGLLLIAAGLGVGAVAASQFGKPAGKLPVDAVAAFIAGFGLVFAGATLAVPERRTGVKAWTGVLMVTAIALLTDWVAFGSGERHLTGGSPSANAAVGPHQLREMSVRLLFAIGAVLFNLMALWAWMRALWRRTAKA
jgi:hypothetical protein